MLEDTNSLDGAHLLSFNLVKVIMSDIKDSWLYFTCSEFNDHLGFWHVLFSLTNERPLMVFMCYECEAAACPRG